MKNRKNNHKGVENDIVVHIEISQIEMQQDVSPFFIITNHGKTTVEVIVRGMHVLATPHSIKQINIPLQLRKGELQDISFTVKYPVG